MIAIDIIICSIIAIVTPVNLIREVKKAQQTGHVAGLMGAMTAIFVNSYIIWRLWP